jgi:uncharacterized membrane protein
VIRVELVTVVDRPVHDVFAYAVDFSHLPTYDRWVESVEKTSEGPIGVGSTWKHVRVQGRRRIEAPIELVVFEPDRRFGIRSGSKGFDVRSMMTFEAQETARRSWSRCSRCD